MATCLFRMTIWISIEETSYTHEASGKYFNYVELMQSIVPPEGVSTLK